MKTLLIRLSSLGDVVLATAAASYIRAQDPGAEITFLTKAPYAPLLAGHPDIQEVWSWEGGMMAMIRRIRGAKFDGVLDLHGKPRTRIFAALSGARSVRMKNHAWNRRLRVWFRGSSLAAPPDVAQRGVMAASELLGSPYQATAPLLSVDGAAAEWADGFLRQQGLGTGEKIIAVCPGASHATKRWPAGAFAQALGLLAERGRKFLFVGDAADAALAQGIQGMARKGSDLLIHAAGKTSFAQLAALLKRSDLLLCNDSGPMHVASALGTPVLALFGPTVEAFGFFPRGPKDRVLQRDLACRPCSVHGGEACPLGHHDCMQKIAPFDVAKALEGMLPQ